MEAVLWNGSKISKINSEMYRALHSAQFQTNDVKMTGWNFTVQMDDFKHTVKKTYCSLMVKSVI